MTEKETDKARIAELEKELVDLKAEHLRELALSDTRLHLFGAIAETVPVGVVLADAAGRIVQGNAWVEKMVRHPVLASEDVDGYGEWVSFHADGSRVKSSEYPLSRVLRDGEDHAELDVHYRRGDGTRFWMRIIGEPVTNSAGERIGAVVALVDIDEERRLQQSQRVLIGELNHRVKNAFSVSQAIVGRILRSSDSDKALIDAIDQRLKAYAHAHAKLVGTDWLNVPLREIAKDVLDPIEQDRIHISGPALVVPSRMSLAMSMAFYELATNAVKHGALSVESGRVDLEWEKIGERTDDERWKLRWIERDGPRPQVAERKGFGSFITGRALMAETRGRTEIEFAEEGFKWSLEMPAPPMDKA